MKIRHGLLAAGLMAVLSFLAVPAFAAGIFTYPAATQAQTNNGFNCFPNDINGPGAPSPSLGGGAPPQTVCSTAGQILAVGNGNPLGVHSNIPIGSVAYGSLGTNTTDIAGQIWLDNLQLPVDKTITGMACLNGGTATTDSFILALYNSAGSLVGNTVLTGTLLSGASAFQQVAFTTPYSAKAGRYWVAWQGNGTTGGSLRTIAASTYLGIATSVVSGSFGTLPATVTAPTTFTANNGPICYVY